MEVTVKLQSITIKDNETDKEYTVRTLRTAKELAEYVEESEKEVIMEKLQDEVASAYDR